MKKILAVIFAAAMLLTACKVGPNESLEPNEPTEPAETVVGAETATPPEEVVSHEVDPAIEDLPISDEEIADEPVFVDEPVIVDEPVADDDDETEEIAVELSDFGTMYATISLNVREGPSTDYDVIGYLDEGEAAEVIGYAADYGWYLIKFGDGSGYVSGNYMTDEAPAQEDEEEPEPLDMAEETAMVIIEDYAVAMSVLPTSVEISNYYGDFPSGEVVMMFSGDIPHSNKAYEFTLADCNFELEGDGYKIELHTKDGDFVDIRDAFKDGLLDSDDIKTVFKNRFNAVNKRFKASDFLPSDGETEEQEIIAAFAKKAGLSERSCFIAMNYGKCKNGTVVLMASTELAYTEAETTLTVAGVTFSFRNGNNNVCLYHDGQLIPLADAYEQGLISKEEIETVSTPREGTGPSRGSGLERY